MDSIRIGLNYDEKTFSNYGNQLISIEIQPSVTKSFVWKIAGDDEISYISAVIELKRFVYKFYYCLQIMIVS